MEKFKEFMAQPYTKGDYYGSLIVVFVLYAIMGVVYVILENGEKIKKFFKPKKRKDDIYEEDEEA